MTFVCLWKSNVQCVFFPLLVVGVLFCFVFLFYFVFSFRIALKRNNWCAFCVRVKLSFATFYLLKTYEKFWSWFSLKKYSKVNECIIHIAHKNHSCSFMFVSILSNSLATFLVGFQLISSFRTMFQLTLLVQRRQVKECCNIYINMK